MPNALLVYPQFPLSYWGYKFALNFIGKKSSMPPLGLLTVAGMFPDDYRLKLVDMNVRPLSDADLSWADFVFTSTMVVQKESLREVIGRCHRVRVPVVAGGPHPTSFHEDIEGVSHFILDEVEETFTLFLRELSQGSARKVYRASEKPDLTRSPLPRYDLIDVPDYGSMALQFSRGCPFDCEFCDITQLYGRVPRTKTNEQVLAELDLLYNQGWRGPLFLVDDNFIGNKRRALGVLPEIARWQKEKDYPFSLFTEASVDLAKFEPLMDAMVEAGFTMVFLGIETPNPQALLKTKKAQNVRKGEENYLLHCVRKIQQRGMEVAGGFILGLDGDREDVFDAQIQFIQQAGIPRAMVGLLNAIKGTHLYQRLRREGRLLGESSGNNVSTALNFHPEMDPKTLVSGYKRVLSTLYDPGLKNYFERCWTMLQHLKPTDHGVTRIGKAEVIACAKSFKKQIFSRQGPAYLRFLWKVSDACPAMLPEAIRLAIMGYHFEKITRELIAVHNFREYLETELDRFRERFSSMLEARPLGLSDVRAYVQDLSDRVCGEYERIHEDFRYAVQDALDSFRKSLSLQLEGITIEKLLP